MGSKPIFTTESLRELISRGEGQYVELKGTWSYEREPATPIGKDKLRATVAEYVAAFANADGGTLIIGVEDDGEVTGHGRDAAEVDDLLAVPERRLRPVPACDHQLIVINDREVIVLEVGRAPKAVMVSGDGFPYRTGDRVLAESEEWINSLKREYEKTGFEQRRADAVPDDLALNLLPAAASDSAWLARRGLVVPRQGSPAVSNAAVLLAGRPPAVRWHPRSAVRVFRVAGTERSHGAERNVTQIDWIEGPLATLIPDTHAIVRTQIRRSEKLHDLFFREVPEYPEFAWQEAIVNAVAHRDYADRSRGVEVWLYDDRLEVSSPGAPMPPVTVESLRRREGIHASRNPLIARVLVELGLMRDEGEGIPRMFDEMERSFLAPPEFSVEHDTTRVTLYNTPLFETADDHWRRIVERATINSDFRRVLLLYPDGFTNEQYRDANPVDRDEAYRQIRQMVEEGLVTAADRAGRGAVYRISPEIVATRSWLQSRIPGIEAFIATHGALTNADYRSIFGVTRETAKRELRRLTEAGAIELLGQGRGAHYVLGSSQ